MEEEKNEIIIKLTENESSTINNHDQVEAINLTGEISVINPTNSRTWNTKLTLSGKDSTNLEKNEYQIGEVKANDHWLKSYSMAEDYIKEPVLSVSEIVDTYYEDDAQNWAGIVNRRMPIAFNIVIKNNLAEQKIKDIVIKKQLPNYFSEPILEENVPGSLSYNSDSREIIWKIPNIDPNETQKAIIRSAFTPNDAKLHGSGAITATYTADIIRTDLSGEITAKTDHFFAVDIGESMDTPGSWECLAEFENSSALNTTLKIVKIHHSKENIKELIIEENPDTEVSVNNSWTKDFMVKSEGLPKFQKDYDFTVNYVIVEELNGQTTRKENKIPIIAAEITKELKPPQVPAYAKNPVKVDLILENTGTAALNEIHLKDVVPADFKPPEKGTVEFFIDGKEILENITYNVEPDNDNPEVKHVIDINLSNLNKIGGFKPGNQLNVKYTMDAWNPQPKVKHECPLEADANVAPPGPAANLDTFDLEIGVKYVRRRIRALKQVQPLGEEGHYKIPVIFQNKGEVELENVVLKDIIPSNFELMNWEPEDIKPEIKEVEGGTSLIWRFAKVEANERLNLSYTIKGSGEYEAPELEYEVE
ncbi:MAG: hypothetical protein GF329_01880 [Candidatus Lokiarchaeota archaeon]|nr:hypothetical protein [Candidatus Lokiarchaeota archaeon]